MGGRECPRKLPEDKAGRHWNQKGRGTASVRGAGRCAIRLQSRWTQEAAYVEGMLGWDACLRNWIPGETSVTKRDGSI